MTRYYDYIVIDDGSVGNAFVSGAANQDENVQ